MEGLTVLARLTACVAAFMVSTSDLRAAGFQYHELENGAGKPIALGIWYPSDTPAPEAPNTPLGQALARGAPVKGSALPLVVLSHGNNAGLGSHAATALALAEAGFVAAALTHPGDNFRDDSAPPSRWMIERPLQVKRVIDFLHRDWRDSPQLDRSRTAVFGFSAGGYTALVAAGAKPNIERLLGHCRDHPEEFLCKIGVSREIERSGLTEVTHESGLADPRISALVVAAPGLGFAFDADGLAGVSAEVQIWAAAQDERVPYASNVAPLAAALPQPPKLHVIEQAGHFAFLPPCDPAWEQQNPGLWATLCKDDPAFDRAAFHKGFNAEIIRFLGAVLR